MHSSQRLPFPYRSESEVVAHRLQAVSRSLDWAAAARAAAPWVQAVRDNPPPFWAMESLLKEYPISSAEGLALMRLAEALLRVPDAETAIALTADQLGRAEFGSRAAPRPNKPPGGAATRAAVERGGAQHDGAGDKVLARLSSAAIALSKHFLPQAVRPELVEGLPPNPLGPLAPGGEEPKKYVVGAMVTVAVARERVQYLNAQGQLITESLRDYNPSPTLAALLKSSKALAVAPNT